MADYVTRENARTSAEVCEAVARWCWYERWYTTDRDKAAECPPDRIPQPAADLGTWIQEFPEAARAETDRLLGPLLATAAVHHWAGLDDDEPDFWHPIAWEPVPNTARWGYWILLGKGSPNLVIPGATVSWEYWGVDGPDEEPAATELIATGNLLGDGADNLFQYARLNIGIAEVHGWWLAARAHDPDLLHPLAPLVDAWQRRPDSMSTATVTATVHNRADSGMIRRPALVSILRRVHWRPDADGDVPLVTGAVVDGEPMAAPRPDTADLFPVLKRRPRRLFKPGEQRTLPLAVVPPIRHDLRLIALADLSGDPALQGDVLALMAFAWAADRPLHVTGRAGAALLARALDGKPRAQIKPTDETRFWEAAEALRALVARDPGGTGKWADLATVEVPEVRPVNRVTIGPPKWARAESSFGKWTLTAEASAASMARAVSGKQGMAGRIITGLEYRLAAGWTGRSGTIAPDLRPADRRRKASAGPVVEFDWRTVLLLAGDWWDRDDSHEDEKARYRYNRAIVTLRKRGYFVPDTPRAEAPAGDSVEIVDQVRPARGRPAGLLVRASARFVQAARLAQLPHGSGFETRKLTDWAGL